MALFKYPAYYQLCTFGATIDTEASAEVQFAKELECGSVKCGNTNTSWSSFVPMCVRLSALKLGMELKIFWFLYLLFRSLASHVGLYLVLMTYW